MNQRQKDIANINYFIENGFGKGVILTNAGKKECISIASSLNFDMIWQHKPEGYRFWDRVYDRLAVICEAKTIEETEQQAH